MNDGRPIIRHPELLPTALLAAALAWAPWPFGSVVPWAEALLVTAVCAALAAAALALRDLTPLRRAAPPVVALLAIALLGALQSLAWPPSLLAALSPAHARLAADAEGALDPGPAPDRAQALAPEGEEAAPPRPEAPAPATVAPSSSRRGAVSFAMAAAALAAAAAAGRRRTGRRILGGALLAAAAAQVLFGAPRWLGSSSVLWGVDVGSGGRLRGSFVNPNHFAVFLEIALAVAFAWTWWGWRRVSREASPERRVLLTAVPALVWLTLFLGLAFSGSRAGLLAGVAGVAVQGALLGLSGRRRDRGRLLPRWALPVAGALVAAAGGVGLVAVVGFDRGLGRLVSTSPYDLGWDVRVDVYRATLELWGLFPWLGSGLATFAEAFPLFQSGQHEAVGLFWRHAHNDWIELLATTGVAGAGLFLAGLAVAVVRLARGLRRGLRSEDRAAALAALGALAAVGVHELADFGLTMPANALALSVVVGAALGVAGTSSEGRDRRPPQDQRDDTRT
jgi:putative inorganic carbon (hco3(-)) transporter